MGLNILKKLLGEGTFCAKKGAYHTLKNFPSLNEQLMMLFCHVENFLVKCTQIRRETIKIVNNIRAKMKQEDILKKELFH